MVIDEFALKAMVEQEDDDNILISKVRSRISSSNSQNDKLIPVADLEKMFAGF